MANVASWVSFFETAGLPPKIAMKYASLFVEHRIRRCMLPDLTKNILNEMGIAAIGDVLAILKQAKIVANREEVEAKETKQKVIGSTSVAGNREKAVAAKAKARVASKPVNMLSPMKRPRLEPPPDHDVEYSVKMPDGSTERSRQLLKKAQVLKAKAPTHSQTKSVFDRLGPVVMDDESPSALLDLRKTVSFATGTKESSPEVTSTTDEYFGKLESDRMARKTSALQRLGNKLTNDRVKVDGGRRILVPKRSEMSIFDRLG